MTVTTLPAARAQAPATFAPAQRGGALSLAHMTPHEAWLFCESLARTPLLPDAYRNNPASVLWAMEYGRALGLDVVTTITTIHVIKGKPTQSADLMLSRAREAGHRVRIKPERERCIVRIVRADDPDDETEIEWTLDDAVTAGLCELRNGRPYARDHKGQPTAWEKYPRAMLRSRALAEAVRTACPEVLHGAIYTPEELGEVVDQEGNPVIVERVDAPPVRQQATVIQRPAEEAPAGPARDYLAEAVATTDETALAEIVAAARQQGAPGPYLSKLDDIREAHAAPDAAGVRKLYDAAQAAGADREHLARLAAIGGTKPGAKKPEEPRQDAPGTTADVPDAEEQAAALGEMYDAAKAAGVDRAEADELFVARHGCQPASATAAQLREQRDDLLDAAGGAQ